MGEVLRLQTGYSPPEQAQESPVSKCRVAEAFGVSVRTVDRWVQRGLPEDDGYHLGAWVQAGAHRRFYLGRVREWVRRQAQP